MYVPLFCPTLYLGRTSSINHNIYYKSSSKMYTFTTEKRMSTNPSVVDEANMFRPRQHREFKVMQ